MKKNSIIPTYVFEEALNNLKEQLNKTGGKNETKN